MLNSLFRLVARVRRLSIVTRLLVGTLLAILISVASVQTWSMYSVQQAQMVEAQNGLKTNLAVLRRELGRIGADFHLNDKGVLTLDGTPLNGRDDITDMVRSVSGGVVTIFAGDMRIATNVTKPDGSRASGTALAAGPARDAVMGRMESYRGPVVLFGTPYLATYEPLRSPDGRAAGILFVGVPLSDAQTVINGLVRQSIVGSLIAVMTFGCLAWLLVTRVVARPIRSLTKAMTTLAHGQTDLTIPGVGRTDEIGQMADAMQVFKDNRIEADRLAAEQHAEQAAKMQRTARIDALTQAFEAEAGQMVGHVAAAATELQTTAQSMTETARLTTHQAVNVAAAAEQASANVQTVAAASEEMAASIAEIARQVTQSAKIAGKAKEDAQRTDGIVKALSDDVRKIGEIVGLISNIAGQTNLLALNATIEAARAGDAGKGFAVVASEVKALATQTAKATDEIARQVTQIQSATKEAVGAIQSIGETIGEISEISAAIANTVGEQGSATQEIARNVLQAANGTQEVHTNINGVSAGATDTGAAATQVLGAAGALSREAEQLRGEVDRYIVGVRAA